MRPIGEWQLLPPGRAFQKLIDWMVQLMKTRRKKGRCPLTLDDVIREANEAKAAADAAIKETEDVAVAEQEVVSAQAALVTAQDEAIAAKDLALVQQTEAIDTLLAYINAQPTPAPV